MKTSLFLLSSAAGSLASVLPGFVSTRDSSSNYKAIPLYYAYRDTGKVMADLLIGSSNSTPIPVVMDLGSANFWVFEYNATVNYGSVYLGFEGPCNVTPTYNYNPFESNTSTPLISFGGSYSYGGNSKRIDAHHATNDTIGSPSLKASETIPNVEIALADFALVRQMDDGTCLGVDYDFSIMGLSPFNASKFEGPSFRDNLYSQGVISNKIQSMWFGYNSSDEAIFNGKSLFGAVDKSKFAGKMVVLPTSNPGVNYAVTKPTMSVNGVNFTTSDDVSCLLDSGSLSESLPIPYGDEESSNFLNATGLVSVDGQFAYPSACEDIPDYLTLDHTFTSAETGTSVTISIPFKNYARSGSASQCILGIVTGNSNCVYGAPFHTGAFFAADDLKGVVGLAQGGVFGGEGEVSEADLVFELEDGLVGSGSLSFIN